MNAFPETLERTTPAPRGWRADLAVWEDSGGGRTPSALPKLERGTPLPACAATVVAGRLIYGSEEWGHPRQDRLASSDAG